MVHPVADPAPRRVIDLGLVLACAGVAALTLLGGYGSPAPAPPAWLVLDTVVAVLAPLSLLLRHRYPVALAAGLVVLHAVTTTAGVAMVCAVFTVTTSRPLRVALTVAAAVVPAAVVHLLARSPGLPFLLGLALVALSCGVGLASGWALRTRRELVASLRERAERAEADQHRRAAEARRAERARIAREMHDVLGHRISLLSMHAGTLAFRPDAPPAEVARSAEVIRSGARQAMTDLREVIGVLRSDDPDPAAEARPAPTLRDLPALLAEARAAGDRIDAALTDPPRTGDVVGRAAYRLVQEGLTNARRHAPGSVVGVRTAVERNGLVVEVANATRPSGTGGPAGTGLLGLRERVALAGGRLEHGTDLDGRFTVRAWLPCDV